MGKKLRLGLLIDDVRIPAWTFYMIDKIQASDYAEIVLMVKNKTNAKRKAPLLLKIYRTLDYYVFKQKPDAFEPKELKKSVEWDFIQIKSIKKNDQEGFTQEHLDTISNYHLDVLIKLGFGILSKDILKLAKYGVWTFNEVDNGMAFGEAGTFEVLGGMETTEISLQVKSANGFGKTIIGTSISSTRRESVYRNRNSYYWKAAEMIPRALKKLYFNREFTFDEEGEKNSKNPLHNEYTSKITNSIVLGYVPKILKGWLKERKKFSQFREQWNLFYHFGSNDSTEIPFSEFKPIECPADRLWADPFIFEKNGSYYLFIEELVYTEGLGKISVMELDKSGSYTPPKEILKKSYHLSYPHLIEDNGELYMIPETKGNKTIELYKCINFPMEWKLEKILMEDIQAVDSTILKYKGKYWMFCNVVENEGISSHDELFLFYSDELISTKWTYHPCNPVISDVRKSRPAGNLFIEKGKLWRPSQDSAKQYGHGMKFNEIVELTETYYKEMTRKHIYPDWDEELHGTHTINNINGLTVIDGLKYLKNK